MGGKLPLPIAVILTSGGRSLHAWVRVDAENGKDYRQTVARMLALLARFGVDGKKFFEAVTPARSATNHRDDRRRATHKLTLDGKRILRAAEGWLELGNCDEAEKELNRIRTTAHDHPDVLNIRLAIYIKAHSAES